VITFQRFGWPVATAHCRASLMQDSVASEPPETKKMRSKPSGNLLARSRANSSAGSFSKSTCGVSSTTFVTSCA